MSLYAWGQCDVPFSGGIRPEKCLAYWEADSNTHPAFRSHLEQAAEDLSGGFGLAMVYFLNVDTVGHAEGPTGELMLKEIRSSSKAKMLSPE